MPLLENDRAYVVETAVDLLRIRQRDRAFVVLRKRLDVGDYDDSRERRLDEIAYAVARAIDDEMKRDTP